MKGVRSELQLRGKRMKKTKKPLFKYLFQKKWNHTSKAWQIKQEWLSVKFELRNRHNRAMERIGFLVNRARHGLHMVKPDILWTYQIETMDEFSDSDFVGRIAASDAAQVRYNEDRSDADDYKHNSEAIVELIQFYWNDKTGERMVLDRQYETVEYEYYHGDYAEHFNQRDYI